MVLWLAGAMLYKEAHLRRSSYLLPQIRDSKRIKMRDRIIFESLVVLRTPLSGYRAWASSHLHAPYGSAAGMPLVKPRELPQLARNRHS